MKKVISMIGLLCVGIAVLSGCSTKQNNFTEKNYTADSSQIQTINIDAIDRKIDIELSEDCLLYTSPSPRDPKTSRMPSSA